MHVSGFAHLKTKIVVLEIQSVGKEISLSFVVPLLATGCNIRSQSPRVAMETIICRWGGVKHNR